MQSAHYFKAFNYYQLNLFPNFKYLEEKIRFKIIAPKYNKILNSKSKIKQNLSLSNKLLAKKTKSNLK